MRIFNLEDAKNGAPVVTRNRNRVKLYAFDVEGNKPILGIQFYDTLSPTAELWTSEGHYSMHEVNPKLDLFIDELCPAQNCKNCYFKVCKL